ncbi:hypothetical protein NIES267_25540 [Calothrix parasitica NIES-267]|uniref:UspA domain-containing protein n=1 Tax=Calothrix parasitica NIES-267 TaxID=1973488 RepID=A0A1Z4LPP6_9CYAN|nr:hypothetical protein NIES267_25540 [Calothrix parasitica NIES-267]
MSFQKILVTLELSPRDESVFSEALNLAKHIGAQLILIHCLSDLAEMAMMSQTGLGSGFGLPGTPSLTTMSPGMVNMDLVAEANTTKHQKVEKHLASFQQQAASQGVSVECKLYEATGSVGSQISQIAQDLNVDLIILGRKGHNAIAEALLGSVSNYVMHHAPCAVLIIQ